MFKLTKPVLPQIGTSACARALSASIDTIMNGDISEALTDSFGVIYGKSIVIYSYILLHRHFFSIKLFSNFSSSSICEFLNNNIYLHREI